ncbi:extracellular solute-binding protein [Cohnella silvisoli]|uniref:Extracellular solute-binding protein n=1 Tax=Cohnella silvisoli TaxID=2873699 RepID=A0ABV1KU40_9BACL|nr:extracellular solute-binding protein [Cohnella silvisoli]MCD9023210.1 extracellular solute-binding protein [Cohnella silvisoli]
MTRRRKWGQIRRRKLPIALAVWLVIGIGVTGCGSGESIIGGSNVEKVMEPAANEEITVWHTYSDVESWTFEHEVIPAFEKQHPEIRVVSVKRPYENIKGALISETTSGSGPDVGRLDMVWLAEFAKLGLVDPIDGYPEFPRISKMIHKTALESSKYAGRYYGVPLNMNTKAAIYSRKLLKQAGLDRPPATMDELVALSERTGWQLGVNGINTWSILPYFTGLGGKLTNDDYTKSVGYLDSPASIRAVQTLKRLLDKGLISEDVLSGKLERWLAIQDGKLLMMDEGPWYYTILSHVDGYNIENMLDNTVLAPFPHNAGQKGAIIGGENLVLMKSSRHKQAAWTFMKWMAGVPAQQIMFKTGLLPTNVEASESKESLSPTIRPYVESLNASFLRPPVTNWAKIDKQFNESFERILRGRVPVEIGLEQLAAQIDEWLK